MNALMNEIEIENDTKKMTDDQRKTLNLFRTTVDDYAGKFLGEYKRVDGKKWRDVKPTKQDEKLPAYHFMTKMANYWLYSPNSDIPMQMLGFILQQETDKNISKYLRLIEVDKSLIPVIENTDNEFFYRPLFFPKVFINTDFHYVHTEYGNITIKGLLIVDQNNVENERGVLEICKDWMIYTVAFNGVNTIPILFELLDTHIDYTDGVEAEILKMIRKYLRNIACNLVDLVMGNGTDDISIVEIKTPPEQNRKRAKRGKIQLPDKVFIKPKEHFKRYIHDFNQSIITGEKHKLSHKFLVRGHWRHFRSDRYTKMKGKSILIYPYVKGEGILISRDYKILN